MNNSINKAYRMCDYTSNSIWCVLLMSLDDHWICATNTCFDSHHWGIS